MRRARPFGRTATRWSSTRRIALVMACCVASFILGALSVDWLTRPSPAPVPAAPPQKSARPADEAAEHALRRSFPDLTFEFELPIRNVENKLVDYVSPEEMLRDLHDRHGAECDRPDLDRRMIDEITPPRR